MMKKWFGEEWPPKRKPRSEEDEDNSVFPPSGADLPMDSSYEGNGTFPALIFDHVDQNDLSDITSVPLELGPDFIGFDISGDGKLPLEDIPDGILRALRVPIHMTEDPATIIKAQVHLQSNTIKLPEVSDE